MDAHALASRPCRAVLASTSGRAHEARPAVWRPHRRGVAAFVAPCIGGQPSATPSHSPPAPPGLTPAPFPTPAPLLARAALLLASARAGLVAGLRALVLGSSGSLSGLPLLAAAAAVPPPFLQPLFDAASSAASALASNSVFMAGFWAWAAAQIAKVFTKRAKAGVWDVSALVDSGGMPSSHSALAVAVTAAAGRTLGLASATFAVALCYALVVMYDAAGVRRHAGKQAEVLNVLLADVVSALQVEHPVASQRLKEVLGHTPRQVAAGAVLGLAVGLLLPLSPGVQAV